MLPDFTDSGVLPVGTFSLTFEQLAASHLVTAAADDWHRGWDVAWRGQLVHNAGELTQELWACGVTDVFLDGSFTEAKAHPNDIDGYFECDIHDLASGGLERRLNQRNPHGIWTWAPASRRRAKGSAKKQLPMWHQYRVELYPHARGLLSGIPDPFGNELQFPSAFRQQRGSGLRKGILQMVPTRSTP